MRGDSLWLFHESHDFPNQSLVVGTLRLSVLCYQRRSEGYGGGEYVREMKTDSHVRCACNVLVGELDELTFTYSI